MRRSRRARHGDRARPRGQDRALAPDERGAGARRAGGVAGRAGLAEYRSSPGCDARSLGRTQGASISVDMGATAIPGRSRWRAARPGDTDCISSNLLALEPRGAPFALGRGEPLEHGLTGEAPVAVELAARQVALRGERAHRLLVDLQQLSKLLDRQHVRLADLRRGAADRHVLGAEITVDEVGDKLALGRLQL